MTSQSYRFFFPPPKRKYDLSIFEFNFYPKYRIIPLLCCMFSFLQKPSFQPFFFKNLSLGQKIIAWGLCGFIFFIPIQKTISTAFEFLSLLGLLIFLFRKEGKLSLPAELKSSLAWIFLPLLFLLYLLGMTYTQDISQGLKELNINHYYFLLPFLFAFLPYQDLSIRKTLIFFFLIANLLAAILTIYISITGNLLFQAEPYLPSPFISRPRASLFYAFSIFLGLEIFYHNIHNRKRLLLLSIALIILSIALVKLEGRSGQIAFITVLPFWMSVRLVKKHRKIWAMAFLVLMCSVSWFSYQYIGNIKRRFDAAIEEVKTFSSGDFSHTNETSVARRFVFLQNSFEVWEAHPWFGVGSGDLQQEVFPKFKDNPYGVDSGKPHNQFLELAVKFGIIGLLIFLITWILVFIRIRSPLATLFRCFSLLCFISMWSESTLDTQAGNTFFTVFFLLLGLPVMRNFQQSVE